MQLTTISLSGYVPDAQRLTADLNAKAVSLVAGRGVANALKEHFLRLNASRHGGFSVVGFYEEAADEVFGGSSGAPARDHGDAVGVGSTKVGLLLRRYGTSILPGGVLRPKDATYLAIPDSAHLGVTHGKSPREFANLRTVFGRQKDTGEIGPIALAADEGGVRVADEDDKISAGAKRPKMTDEEREEARELRAERDEFDDRRVKFRQSRKMTTAQKALQRETLREAGHNLKPGLEGEILYWLKKQVFQAEDETVLPGDEELQRAGLAPALEYLNAIPAVKTVGGAS